MKSNAQPSIYFSAYPLKAISPETTAPASTDVRSPYLKAILSGKTRTMSRVRVFPMINPYRKPSGLDNQHKPSERLKTVENKLPTDIELTEKEWFNNYE